MGFGVIIVGVFFVIGVFVCILGRMTPAPMWASVAGTLLPFIAFGILYYLPKEASRPKAASQSYAETESRPVTFGLFFVIIMFVAFLSLILWL